MLLLLVEIEYVEMLLSMKYITILKYLLIVRVLDSIDEL